mmetsp:Transcript_32715/g.98923  ORF Transcript_32715/g.98923 Transcript_32715/m.98923 type:complete len:206 (-) Transcript_32715:235-852(-)
MPGYRLPSAQISCRSVLSPSLTNEAGPAATRDNSFGFFVVWSSVRRWGCNLALTLRPTIEFRLSAGRASPNTQRTLPADATYKHLRGTSYTATHAAAPLRATSMSSAVHPARPRCADSNVSRKICSISARTSSSVLINRSSGNRSANVCKTRCRTTPATRCPSLPCPSNTPATRRPSSVAKKKTSSWFGRTNTCERPQQLWIATL